jgi:lysozyme family protein
MTTDTRFDRAMPLVLAHEGGFSDHPEDPGGATMQGVTQRTYDAWRALQGEPARSVRLLEPAERDAIYYSQYWLAIRAPELPDGVAYCTFDAAVNSGPSRAARWLQEAVGVEQDGVIGSQTIAAVQAADARGVIHRMCEARMAFLRRLRTWPTFGRGWSRRVSEVQAAAIEFSYGATPAPAREPAPGAGQGPERPAASINDAMRTPAAWTGIGGAIGGVASMASGEGPVQYALAVALVLVTVAAVVLLVRRARA